MTQRDDIAAYDLDFARLQTPLCSEDNIDPSQGASGPLSGELDR